MERAFVIAGSLFMLLAVAAGAFGAHGLATYFTRYPDLEDTFEIAVRYQAYHALGLIATAWASSRWPGALTNWAGYLFIIGIIIFSGSLFLLVLSRARWLGAITPLGGVAFLAGWLCLLLAAWRN
jgi:uncharacterized membrane protein YgdD (TMEM256/DUF423 family)